MRYLTTVLLTVVAMSAHGASYTVDENGIDALSTGLNGDGIEVGQVEPGRPGMKDYDTNPNLYTTNAIPKRVYEDGNPAAINNLLTITHEDHHANKVAGVMIGTDDPFPIYMGAAPAANLYANTIGSGGDVLIAQNLERIVTLGGVDNDGEPIKVRAMNMSFVHELEPFVETLDGDSHFTQYVDWAARAHDVLFLSAWGNYDSPINRAPTDNFNGLTVAASGFENEDDEMYTKFSWVNATDGDADGDRTSIDILAPGENIRVKGTASTPGGEWDTLGTSMSTAHVTGATALLQQYVGQRVGSVAGFDENSQRHEVMKAVMLNSADKLAGVHGSVRTILDSNNQDWTQSPEGMSQFTVFDDQMGAGHLNVRRAVNQLASGECEPGVVPLIGWDYGNVGGTGSTQEYYLDGELTEGQYIAVTLAWDRRVVKTSGGNYLPGDQFIPYNTVDEIMNNLDIHLMTADGTDLILDSYFISESFDANVEHIFWKNFPTGDYKIVVNHRGGIGDDQDYALAWWYGSGPPADVPGDFDHDGDVDPFDLQAWKDGFGPTFDGADFLAWQQNYGFGVPATPTAATVPEPSAWLLMTGLPFLLRRQAAM